MEEKDNMTKTANKQDANGPESLTLRGGERVEFPPEPGSKYAAFHRTVQIKTLKQIEDFVFPGVGRRPERKLDTLIPGKVKESVLNCLDLIIPHGATMTLNDPVNRITARKVKIGGTLVSNGHLSIECKEIVGGSGVIELIVSPGRIGEDHGNDPKPDKPPRQGNGANAWSDLSHLFYAGDGGNGEGGKGGTRGGDGEIGPVGATLLVTVEALGTDLTYRCPGGDGGNGGNGGPGGDGGDAGDGGGGYGILHGGNGGTGGTGGTAGAPGWGGSGGNGGTIDITCKEDNSDSTNTYDVHGGHAGRRGYHGTSGLGGNGGSAGPNSEYSIGSGSNGQDGDNGEQGDTSRDGLRELGRDGTFGQVTVRIIP